jgi:hypothetical protein
MTTAQLRFGAKIVVQKIENLKDNDTVCHVCEVCKFVAFLIGPITIPFVIMHLSMY